MLCFYWLFCMGLCPVLFTLKFVSGCTSTTSKFLIFHFGLFSVETFPLWEFFTSDCLVTSLNTCLRQFSPCYHRRFSNVFFGFFPKFSKCLIICFASKFILNWRNSTDRDLLPIPSNWDDMYKWILRYPSYTYTFCFQPSLLY